MKSNISFSSLCAREPKEQRYNTPHQLPIYAASSFIFESFAEGEAIFSGEQAGHIYSRFGNPTIDAVAEKLAQMESYGSDIQATAQLTSSGMSAISTLFTGLLQKGDKILTHHGLYGGSTALMTQQFAAFGIEMVTTSFQDLSGIQEMLQADPQIKLLYFETPTNPTLRCTDISAVCEIARNANRLTAIDNTFSSPALQRPIVLGADFVIHSTTKYLNGHGTAIGGAIIGRDPDLMQEKIVPALRLMGTNSNSFDAWLLHNGLKTLALRMEKQSGNATKIAQYLFEHPAVDQVHHLSLPSHPDHDLAKQQMAHFGGIISFELKGGLEAAKNFMDRLQFCTISPTLGDVDTMILYPAGMSHRSIDRDIRIANGITDGLIRINVGIEDVEDIIGDLGQAISLGARSGERGAR